MLPVGDRPLLEFIVEQLREAGIRQVNVATHYKSEMIADHFKDGQDFGVDIRYVKEDQPLGTAGALSLLEESDEPLAGDKWRHTDASGFSRDAEFPSRTQGRSHCGGKPVRIPRSLWRD